MGLFNWLRREGVDRVTGAHKKRQEFIRGDREHRELRLERRQVKWLGARGKRHRKRAEGAYATQKNATTHARSIAERLNDPALKKYAIRQLDKAENVDKLAAKRQVPEEDATMAVKKIAAQPTPAPSQPELLDPRKQPPRKNWLTRLLKQRPDLDALDVKKIPRGGMSPAQRGGFTPTPGEYEKETIPEYIATGEELERWRELGRADKAFDKACKARDKRKGPGVCREMGMLEKGHTWWKVPRQAEFECVECGRNGSSNCFDLRRGRLLDIRGGLITRDVRYGVGLLQAGQGAELLGTGPEAERMAKALIVAGQPYALEDERPLYLKAVRDAEKAGVMVKEDELEWAELAGQYDMNGGLVCANCGTAKGAHRDQHVETIRLDGSSRWQTRLLCPRHGHDAT